MLEKKLCFLGSMTNQSTNNHCQIPGPCMKTQKSKVQRNFLVRSLLKKRVWDALTIPFLSISRKEKGRRLRCYTPSSESGNVKRRRNCFIATSRSYFFLWRRRLLRGSRGGNTSEESSCGDCCTPRDGCN